MGIKLRKTLVIACDYCGDKREIQTQNIVWIGKRMRQRVFEYICPVCGGKEMIGEKRALEDAE